MTAYKDLFTRADQARDYDRKEYGEKSGARLYSQFEISFLKGYLEALPETQRQRYLDFACGTGRIISALEDLFAESTGLDLSQAMLDTARSKIRKASLLCGDFESGSFNQWNDHFHCITAFRFLPNVEETIGRRALFWWKKILHPQGLLIVNTHLNPWSYKILLWPWHALKSLLSRKPMPRYYPVSLMKRELESAGFEVIHVYGAGCLSGKGVRWLPIRWSEKIESLFAGSSLAAHFGSNIILVCRRKNEKTG